MRTAIPSIWRGLGNGWGKQLLLTAVLTCGVSFPDRGNAQAQETGGIGGTGIGQETGGIGGTGITPETGGIGGTGLHKLDVPIVGDGPIQAFGSVFVNGREYVVNSSTLVSIDGTPATLPPCKSAISRKCMASQ